MQSEGVVSRGRWWGKGGVFHGVCNWLFLNRSSSGGGGNGNGGITNTANGGGGGNGGVQGSGGGGGGMTATTAVGISVECCLLMFIFVLGVTGHGIYLLWMYGEKNSWTKHTLKQYVVERFALGVVNAVLTLAFLVLLKKMVTKWIASVDSEGGTEGEGWKLVPVFGGTLLSMVAAFEVYMVLSLAGL